MAWTRFMDMHSGGGAKTDYEYIYVEARSEDEAIEIFEKEFGQSPYEIACDCCGGNFSISSYPSLEDATDFDREWSEPELELYVKHINVRVIYNFVN